MNETTLSKINPTDASLRLRQIVTEAYKRRSRQLPNNIPEVVETLKADLLKYMPGVTLDTIDEAVTYEVLHDDKTPISPTFFFAAVRKHYTKPAEVRDEDRDELWQWKDRLRWLEGKGLGNSIQANECRWWIYHIETGDTEQETIALLDICAGWVAKTDEQKQSFTVKTDKGVVVELPAFNARREYAYLVTKGILPLNAIDDHFNEAISDINADRLASRHQRLTRDEARTHPDVVARQKRLAVISWLRSCNEQGRKPSDILTPLMDEYSYQQLRKTV